MGPLPHERPWRDAALLREEVAMKLGRVKGTVVSTISSAVFDERRLLLCEILDRTGATAEDYTIAVDVVDAGFGETVLILDEGNSARQIVGWDTAPIRAVVVGVVDELTVDGQRIEVTR